MIKFFRKIRQQFLSENRFSKYLIYAIGEIALVVIVILIALQVNNWNEVKKERTLTMKLLKNLSEEINQDSIYFSDVYNAEKRIFLNAAEILFREHSKEKITLDYEATIGTAFRFASFTPVIKFSDNAYKELMASELLDQIKSEELKSALFKY